ncbi:hypothetical protein WJX72_006887 [[Myrmecia] bisecta]|uniref:F-box/LRR-repeat protein 15-like leucin rich repeat domain-containing protein n=1 Tax=[Myrmecia] bisecta TaxID=41462 RepID=A0AAW1Q4E5_9CHLO
MLHSLSGLRELACTAEAAEPGINHFHNLRSLSLLTSLSLAEGITDQVCLEVAFMQHLRHLDLSRSTGEDPGPTISDTGCRQLAKLPSLMRLNLEGHTDITDKGLAALAAGLSALTYLDMRQTGGQSEFGLDGFSDGGLERLSQLQRLECLRLSECQVS